MGTEMTYRNDEEAQLYKRVADLEDENRKLRAEKPQRKPLEIETVAMWIFLVLGCTITTLILAAGVRAATLPSEIHHCYLNLGTSESICGSRVYLIGAVEWGVDQQLSVHANVNDAVRAADQLHCPLLRRP